LHLSLDDLCVSLISLCREVGFGLHFDISPAIVNGEFSAFL
jgi:hypothetical protein